MDCTCRWLLKKTCKVWILWGFLCKWPYFFLGDLGKPEKNIEQLAVWSAPFHVKKLKMNLCFKKCLKIQNHWSRDDSILAFRIYCIRLMCLGCYMHSSSNETDIVYSQNTHCLPQISCCQKSICVCSPIKT